VELAPGQFEPNDIAKKVLRILKKGVSALMKRSKLKKHPEYRSRRRIRPPGDPIYRGTMKAEFDELRGGFGEARLFPRRVSMISGT